MGADLSVGWRFSFVIFEYLSTLQCRFHSLSFPQRIFNNPFLLFWSQQRLIDMNGRSSLLGLLLDVVSSKKMTRALNRPSLENHKATLRTPSLSQRRAENDIVNPRSYANIGMSGSSKTRDTNLRLLQVLLGCSQTGFPREAAARHFLVRLLVVRLRVLSKLNQSTKEVATIYASFCLAFAAFLHIYKFRRGITLTIAATGDEACAARTLRHFFRWPGLAIGPLC